MAHAFIGQITLMIKETKTVQPVVILLLRPLTQILVPTTHLIMQTPRYNKPILRHIMPLTLIRTPHPLDGDKADLPLIIRISLGSEPVGRSQLRLTITTLDGK